MKMKLFFGALIALFIGINTFQAFQIQSNHGSFALKQLFEANSANAENSFSYESDIRIENDLCDSCCDGTQCTCECKRYSHNCLSGGDEQCDYLTWIMISDDCTLDGGPC